MRGEATGQENKRVKKDQHKESKIKGYLVQVANKYILKKPLTNRKKIIN